MKRIERVFFTADQHFGHDNIRKHCNRPFTTVDEMDAQLIENWNRVVRSQDSVFHLGDFCLRAENTETYRKQLNGQITLIRGDHDKRVPPGVFAAVHDSYTFESLDIRIVLCHYAMRVWDRSHFEAWHLFAHSHGMLPPWGKSFDIGVDAQEFTPRSLDEVIERMRNLPDRR